MNASMKKLNKIAKGPDTNEKKLLANALLIEKIKRDPLSTGKCIAVLELITKEKK